jgi:hypothetical protein
MIEGEALMKLNFFDRAVLALAMIFLGLIALRPLFAPEVARAQANVDHLYIEPGIKTLLSPDRTRQVQGKVVVDLTNGNIWGFPTSTDVPYPIDPTKPQPATSAPVYLGKFDFAAMQR